MQLSIIDIIIYLFGNLFRIYIVSILFRGFFDIKSTAHIKIVRIIEYILFYIINSAAFLYFAWSPNIILLTNIIGVGAIVITYSGTWKYRACAAILSLTIYIICEDLLYYLIVLLKIEHILVVGIIAADIIFFMIALLLKKLMDFKSNSDIAISEWIAVILIPTLSLVVSIVVLDKCSNEIAVATGEICLVLVNILTFFLLDKTQIIYQERLDMNLLKQQNQAYENQMLLINELEERISSLQHDLKNHFFSLEKLAEQSNSEAVRNYLNKLMPDTEIPNSFAETGNFVIDSFINSKLTKASNLGTRIEIELRISKDIRIDDKEISIILGNLLDNAITAVEKCKQEKIIKIIMRETPGKLFIKIENSHQEIIKKVGNRIISTKGNKRKHGIGLKNVQKVVESHQGIMEIEYNEKLFSVELLMFL